MGGHLGLAKPSPQMPPTRFEFGSIGKLSRTFKKCGVNLDLSYPSMDNELVLTLECQSAHVVEKLIHALLDGSNL